MARSAGHWVIRLFVVLGCLDGAGGEDRRGETMLLLTPLPSGRGSERDWRRVDGAGKKRSEWYARVPMR